MEYLTLDGRYTKLYGYHFILANHFQHNIRVNFPSYLLQSLAISTQAILRDPTREHVCHEGLMVLIMKVLKSKKILKPRNFKVEYLDTEGSIQEKDYESGTQDEAEGGLASHKIGLGGSNKKKKKNIEKEDFDWERESDFVEEIVREHIKNRGGSKGKGKGCHDERASSHSDDEPLVQCLMTFLRLNMKEIIWLR